MTRDECTKITQGVGYGARADTTAAADAAARVLVDLYGLPVEKRGGVGGGSCCGAYHDALPEFFMGVRYWELSGLLWFAGFGFLRERYDEVVAEVPNGHIFIPQRINDHSPSEAQRFQFGTVWSPDCETMHMAVMWLTTHGAKFNEKLAVVDQGDRALRPAPPDPDGGKQWIWKP